jgi:hypothetical protein
MRNRLSFGAGKKNIEPKMDDKAPKTAKKKPVKVTYKKKIPEC